MGAMRMRSIVKGLRRVYKTVSSFGVGRGCRYLGFMLANALLRGKQAFPPNAQPEVLLLSLPLSSPAQPPLGIASVRSYLAERGIAARCMDLNNRLYRTLKNHREYPYDKLHHVFLDEGRLKEFHDSLYDGILEGWAEEIVSLKPRFVGISVNSHLTFSSLARMVRLLRQSDPAIKVILGGPSCKSEGRAMMERDYGDVVVKGEGEKSFFEVIDACRHGRPLEGIPGILYKGDGGVVDAGEPTLVGDLDSLPFPDFDDFPIWSYQRAAMGLFPKLPIMGSRGCPARCDFCSVSFLWGRFRQRSAKSIFAEMKRNKERYGVCDFSFNDSLINVNPRVLEELCNLIIAGRETFRWNGSYRIWQKPMSRSFFEKMARAGCSSLAIGVESGSERVRKSMRKPFTNETLREELRGMHEAGIHSNLMFIIGHPTETAEEYDETLKIVEEVGPYIGSVSFGHTFLIVPETPFWRGEIFPRISYDKKGDWYLGDNTMKERLRRLDAANRFAARLGLVSSHSLLKTDRIKLP